MVVRFLFLAQLEDELATEVILKNLENCFAATSVAYKKRHLSI